MKGKTSKNCGANLEPNMINKIAKCSATVLTVATAKDALSPMEFFDTTMHPQVEASTGVDWALGVTGFILGGLVESGANIGAIQPCVGQVADVAESIYFTYFYIRAFIEKRGIQYITYMSVYVSRGIESTTHGPCWSLKKDIEPAPSE